MKRFLAFLLCTLIINISTPLYTLAVEESDNITVEHIQLPKKLAKKTPTNAVNKTDTSLTILPYNTIQVAFANNFTSKTAKTGDEIVFVFPQNVVTKEGSTVIPEASRLYAKITKVEKPKSFNRSGKIYLNFEKIEFPNGNSYPISAKLFDKKEFLSRGKLNAWGKGFGSTLGGSAVGIAAGCGIGIAASAVIIGGFAIGLPVGFAVGAIAGLATPGLYFKAKAGDKVNIQLLNNVVIEK